MLFTYRPFDDEEKQVMMLRNYDYLVVLDDKIYIASEIFRDDEDGSITANLYRNLDDYRNERVMKPRFTYWL